MDILQERFLNMEPAMNLVLNENINKMQKNGKKIFHLGFGQSPFPVPDFAQEALRKNAGQAEYLAVKGLQKTRQLICDYHARIDQLTYFTAEDVIIGPGSKDLIYLLLCVLQGDVYLLSPTWTTYRPQASVAGKKTHILKTSPTSGWKVRPDLLKPFLKDAPSGSVLIFCNPDNPTGACYTEEELKTLAAVIKETNVIVLCDEIYARLKYDGRHHSLAKFLPQQSILSSGISKWASCGGWRLGYHAYPTELRQVFEAVHAVASNSFTCASSPIQHAAQSLLKFDQEAADYAKHCSRILQAIGNYSSRALSEAGVDVVYPGAGYYIFPDFEPFKALFKARGITSGVQMCDALLKEANVALLAGGPAFLHDTSRFTVRLCFINFDGKVALKASQEIGLSTSLPEDFAEKFCKNTVDSIRAIIKWLERLQEQNRL